MVRQDYRALTALFAAFLFLTSVFVQAPLIGSSTSHAMSNAPLTFTVDHDEPVNCDQQSMAAPICLAACASIFVLPDCITAPLIRVAVTGWPVSEQVPAGGRIAPDLPPPKTGLR